MGRSVTRLERLTAAAQAVLATDHAQGRARLADASDRQARARLAAALVKNSDAETRALEEFRLYLRSN